MKEGRSVGRKERRKEGRKEGHYSIYKLDGVGPVDNRPSTNKLHHFVQKRKKKEKRNEI